jgi:DNA-binding transcriptional regulator YiaG
MVDLSASEDPLSVSRRRYKRKPYRPVDHAKFKETRYLARLTVQEVAWLLHVTARTVANWESGKVAIPYAAFKLLRLHLGYELPGDAWKGWSLRGDTLWSPEGRPYTAAYLSYHWLTFAMARSWHQHAEKQRVSAEAQAKRARALRLVKS